MADFITVGERCGGGSGGSKTSKICRKERERVSEEGRGDKERAKDTIGVC